MIYLITILSVTTLMLMMLLTLISILISKKMSLDREKSSPFECGFSPKNSARLPFSLQFFIITLMFLIFDVEITLIIPIIITIKMNNMLTMISVMVIFMMVLILGLLHEWNHWLI
uniref:NADH-ubiquinone oxidoreductase chain 3 n=1 Tax=Brasilocerus sp. 2 DTA-2012 TaxID=1176494 RepID=A0A0H3UL14_9COLE|nr:NADH dehydrogenase subunit 3 [Brasilocerus sp. 2 DTA-2012]